MSNNRKHIRAALLTALGYGLGFLVGVALIKLLFDSSLLVSVRNLFDNQHLFIGILILFLVVMLGGAIAGTIGGLSLSYAIGTENWKRTSSRSAIGIGFGFGVVLLPIVFLLSMLATYNAGGASPAGFVIAMGVVGALFGFVSGVMTATLPQRGNYWRVTAIVTMAFSIGGLAFGFGLWHYFYTLYQTGTGTAALLFAFFLFGAVGGLVMGWLFSRDIEKVALAAAAGELIEQGNILYRAGQWFKSTKFYRKRGFWGTVLFFVVIYVLSRLIALSPLESAEAVLADQLPLDSIGIHWSDTWAIADGTELSQPSVAQHGDLLVVAWVQDEGVYYAVSDQLEGATRLWQTPVKISRSANSQGSEPQIAVDSARRIHFIWSETLAGEGNASVIFYRSCLQGDCSPGVALSNPESAACGGDQNTSPVISINSADEIMAVWNSGGELASLGWSAGADPTGTPGCALPVEMETAANPRLAALRDGNFVLAFDDGGKIFVAVSTDTNIFEARYQEAGTLPDVLVDADGTVHAVWCGVDGQLRYREEGTLTKTIPEPGCSTRPALGQASDGRLHLVWHADFAEQPSGKVVNTNLIYESRLVSSVWTAPTIVDFSAADAQPDIATGSDGLLHLVWAGNEQINYASYRIYECSEADLNLQGQLALEVADSGEFRPSDSLVPYCQNQFVNLLILPKADPAYSDNPPTLNGAFDDVAELVKNAHYEVLLSTMWYETDDTGTSPGDVLAQGVKALYDQVKAHPEQYPRGITIRILLDNPPEFTLSNLISQVWNVFHHMRRAGLPTMSDPEIGWNLEIANYNGSWPHGHTKMVVIDGKTAVAAGFNYQHKHQSKDHPSGKGKDDYDLGLEMTGPVAQTTQISFDDLWYGSNRIVCPDLDSDSPLWWISCRRQFATTEHVPEVKKLFLAPENHNAFALHRTQKFRESDTTVPTVVASAQETLDVLQVNFTLKLICDVNVIFPVCDFRDALVYMQAMMEAIEANHVKTRVLIKPGVIEGVESNVAVKAFRDALEARGLSDLAEFRYFQDSVHAKAVLIDNQFLLVGSQNFHYSAYGDSALTEFNIGTDDPDAIAAFKRFFDYHWERGKPIPEE